MCLELRVPNVATRTLLWRRLGAEHGVALCDADAARLTRLVPAAPTVAAAALRATRLAGGCAETARLIVERVARAVRGGGLPVPEPEPDSNYDPALVNADADLATLEEDLLRPGAPRALSFLLVGPPGAGKSAWIRHLPGRMGLPVRNAPPTCSTRLSAAPSIISPVLSQKRGTPAPTSRSTRRTVCCWNGPTASCCYYCCGRRRLIR